MHRITSTSRTSGRRDSSVSRSHVEERGRPATVRESAGRKRHREHLDEPGGGKRVRSPDPLGYQIEVVCGMQQLAPLPRREASRSTRARTSCGARASSARRRAPAVAGQAHRARGADDAERARKDSLVSRDVRLRAHPTRSTTARPTTSSRRSTAATAATRSSTITRCSASSRRTPASTICRSRCRASTTSWSGHEHLERAASTGTSGASAGICSAARSSTTGKTRGGACTSTGPTPTC